MFCDKRLSVLSGTEARPEEVNRVSRNRTEFERDFDRVLFSAPVRRLADKTQVFPLEKNDSVRNRLTHSHEVSNLCRSILTQLLRAKPQYFKDAKLDAIDISTIGATVGLAHDLGNPPFGHQGENAIGRWFKKNEKMLFTAKNGSFNAAQKNDFINWEGNAQTFRLLTRLQTSKGEYGLDLTAATLAALIKYTGPSDKADKNGDVANKKFGYFQADVDNFKTVIESTELVIGKRHPIAYIMEACDDIAYSVIDIEDAIKKNLVSINDVIIAIKNTGKYKDLIKLIEEKVKDVRTTDKSPSEINDIGAQYYRTFTIDYMVQSVIQACKTNKSKILAGTLNVSLIEKSKCGKLCKRLKDFAYENAYTSSSVKELELKGDNLLHKLLNYFWRSIQECSLNSVDLKHLKEKVETKEKTPFGEFVYSHISKNYVNSFMGALKNVSTGAETRYYQLLLLTDMISGMTENFAIDLLEKFERLDDGERQITN